MMRLMWDFLLNASIVFKLGQKEYVKLTCNLKSKQHVIWSEFGTVEYVVTMPSATR
jgi:hypothetical protein